MKKAKRRPLVWGGIGLAVLAAAVVIIFLISGSSGTPETFRFAEVTRGSIRTTIASTGTISAQKTVDVGTQVSGQLAGVYADFNDRVHQGQVLARLDTTLLELAVQTAEADRLKARAQYDLAQKEYENNKLLHDKALISDYDFETSRVARDTANATRLSAEANLSRAKINLNYAVITSPIDGVIINRTVEAGQTVAASLSAPTLFTIAEDLSNIQIRTYVAESDIGSIKNGQKVTFSVTTYPEDTFSGSVDIVHLQPETVQNVVNYVVMVKAANADQKLMPGMTATVEFIINERENAWLVPNGVLQYKPPQNLLAAFTKEREERSGEKQGREAASDVSSSVTSARQGLSDEQRTALREQTRGRNQEAGGDGRRAPAQLSEEERAAMRERWQQRRAEADSNPDSTGDRAGVRQQLLPADMKMLWSLDEKGKLTGFPVRVGISDGQNTEIISDHVEAGMKFLTASGGSTVKNDNNRRDFRPRMFF